MRSQRLYATALFAVLVVSCKGKIAGQGIGAPPAVKAPSTKPIERPVASVDLVDRLARCEVDHAGVLVDLGSPSAQGVTGSWLLSPDPAIADAERDGETWARVLGRSLVVRFVLDEPEAIYVSMRVRGGISRSAAVALDGKPLGAVSLVRGQARVVSTRATAAPVPAGPHAIEIRFAGSARGQSEPLAEVDWVRAATSEEESGTFAPPTLSQIVSNVPLSGVPHRSIALRAQSTLRCSTFVPVGARFKLAMGFEGQGEGEGEVQVARDGESPAAIRTDRVKGGDRAEWTPIDVPLDAFAGKVITLELKAKSGNPGGRLLFGDPTLYLTSDSPPPAPAAKVVVVVVLAGVVASKLDNHVMYPALAELDRVSTKFEAHRAPTTVTAGVVSSLLTGLSPRAHGVEDAGARLPGSLTTLGVAARDGSVQTAMFSGCPTTSEAFGFARGWDKYTAYSPVEGAPAVAPLTEAAAWTVEHMRNTDARALVVIHARGGHPPWDVTINEAAKLAPPEYSGAMEPRRGAEVIARARGKHARFRLSENDRTRMWAIYDAALAGQDRALGQLVDALKKSNLWDETLFVVTGDVSMNPESRAPFGDGEDLAEDLLKVPLWVHFPGGALGGKKVHSPTEVVDVSRSVLDALRLPTPDGFEGVDLFATASGASPPCGRPLHATLGTHYSSRLGDFTLSGTAGNKSPALCDLVSDPNCEIDRFEKMPRAAALLFRIAFDAEALAQKRRKPREPATVDANTAAALQVWGE
jgi:arylsulfatase A-like enzyme